MCDVWVWVWFVCATKEGGKEGGPDRLTDLTDHFINYFYLYQKTNTESGSEVTLLSASFIRADVAQGEKKHTQNLCMCAGGGVWWWWDDQIGNAHACMHASVCVSALVYVCLIGKRAQTGT